MSDRISDSTIAAVARLHNEALVDLTDAEVVQLVAEGRHVHWRPGDPMNRVEELEKRLAALENPPCCKGGPQWGHAWDCPKCPD